MSESRDLGLVTDPSLGIIIWVLDNNRVGGPVSRTPFLSKDSESFLRVPVESLRWGDLGRSSVILMEGWQLKESETEELPPRQAYSPRDLAPSHNSSHFLKDRLSAWAASACSSGVRHT